MGNDFYNQLDKINQITIDRKLNKKNDESFSSPALLLFFFILFILFVVALAFDKF